MKHRVIAHSYFPSFFLKTFIVFICVLRFWVTLLQIDLKFRINISDDDILFWETNGTSPKLIIESARDVVQIFVNGYLTGIGQCVNSLLNVNRDAVVWCLKWEWTKENVSLLGLLIMLDSNMKRSWFKTVKMIFFFSFENWKIKLEADSFSEL